MSDKTLYYKNALDMTPEQYASAIQELDDALAIIPQYLKLEAACDAAEVTNKPTLIQPRGRYENAAAYAEELKQVVAEYNEKLEKYNAYKDIADQLKAMEAKLKKILPTLVWFRVEIDGVAKAVGVETGTWGGGTWDLKVADWDEENLPLLKHTDHYN